MSNTKTLSDYKDLYKELLNVRESHRYTFENDITKSRLDALYICIRKAPSMNWRMAKKIGMTKDYYYGWFLFSTSTNSNGEELKTALAEKIKGYDLVISERQL